MESTHRESTPVDDAMAALSDVPRRRLLLAIAARTGPPAEPRPLSELVPGDEWPSRAKSYHVHRPRLDHLLCVTNDREQGTVEPGPSFDELRPLLSLLREHESVLPVGLV